MCIFQEPPNCIYVMPIHIFRKTNQLQFMTWPSWIVGSLTRDYAGVFSVLYISIGLCSTPVRVRHKLYNYNRHCMYPNKTGIFRSTVPLNCLMDFKCCNRIWILLLKWSQLVYNWYAAENYRLHQWNLLAWEAESKCPTVKTSADIIHNVQWFKIPLLLDVIKTN